MSTRPKTLVKMGEQERNTIRSWVLPLVEQALSSEYVEANVEAGVKTISAKNGWKEFEYTGKRTLTISWRH